MVQQTVLSKISGECFSCYIRGHSCVHWFNRGCTVWWPHPHFQRMMLFLVDLAESPGLKDLSQVHRLCSSRQLDHDSLKVGGNVPHGQELKLQTSSNWERQFAQCPLWHIQLLNWGSRGATCTPRCGRNYSQLPREHSYQNAQNCWGHLGKLCTKVSSLFSDNTLYRMDICVRLANSRVMPKIPGLTLYCRNFSPF